MTKPHPVYVYLSLMKALSKYDYAQRFTKQALALQREKSRSLERFYKEAKRRERDLARKYKAARK